MPSHQTAKLYVTLLAAATLTLFAAGCGSSESTESPSSSAQSFTGEVPDFSGPYATEFAQFYTNAESDFVRDVLKDEAISDAEYAEMVARFTTCLGDQGISFEGFKPDGSFTTSLAPNGGDTHTTISDCSASSGEQQIGALRSFTNQNPENLDIPTITAECLVNSGTVPADYSADDYLSDAAGRFADFENLEPALQEALVTCSSNPLGADN